MNKEETEQPTFTVFTTDGFGYDMYVDRWNVVENRVFFHRGTNTEPWFDIRADEVLWIARNR